MIPLDRSRVRLAMFNIFILFYFAEDEKRYQNENVATAGLVYGSPDRVQNAAPRMAIHSAGDVDVALDIQKKKKKEGMNGMSGGNRKTRE